VDQIGVDVLGEPPAEQVEIEVEHPSVGVEIVGRKALVNIAAKIEEHAGPERCWSVKMSWEASDPVDVVFTEFGPVELKGIAEPSGSTPRTDASDERPVTARREPTDGHVRLDPRRRRRRLVLAPRGCRTA
jgi:hypothetical protein